MGTGKLNAGGNQFRNQTKLNQKNFYLRVCESLIAFGLYSISQNPVKPNQTSWEVLNYSYHAKYTRFFETTGISLCDVRTTEN